MSVFVTTVMIAGLAYGSTLISSIELKGSRSGLDRVRAHHLANAGVEQAISQVKDAIRKTAVTDPLMGLRSLFDDGAGGYQAYAPFQGEPVVDGSVTVGEFTVSMTAADRDNGLDITIRSTGYIPAAPQNLPPQAAAPIHAAVESVIHVTTETARVFDSAYFINNWGWFYGNSIHCNGNARSNGQFDVGGYSPTITGQPTYDDADNSGTAPDLIGYRDDNEDGLEDGKDGGIFAGWDIVSAHNVQGEGGNNQNQHDFEDPVAMPNLTDLSPYESVAIGQGGKIEIGGVQVSNAVVGDEGGEKQNLYLIGTPSDPIEITGTVVVRGDVIIAGTVTGQGAIYAGGNVYVPDNLSYANGPTTARPTANSESATEAWLDANKDKDFLGLFATESVVIGDHTNSTWRWYVDWWLSHSMNESREDSGEDQIPNTAAGKDGISGTEDDDVLENDDVFTTDIYTTTDQTLGLIPPGKSVGDAVPGTGEDIDGDGQYDGTIGLTDLDLSTPLNETYWQGNMPPGGPPSYSSIASTNMTLLEGVFYTNHAFAWLTVPSSPINVNGAICSRNESIIYGGPGMHINYDCRLLGGENGMAGELLPRTVAPIQTLTWRTLAHDPNAQGVALP